MRKIAIIYFVECYNYSHYDMEDDPVIQRSITNWCEVSEEQYKMLEYMQKYRIAYNLPIRDFIIIEQPINQEEFITQTVNQFLEVAQKINDDEIKAEKLRQQKKEEAKKKRTEKSLAKKRAMLSQLQKELGQNNNNV